MKYEFLALLLAFTACSKENPSDQDYREPMATVEGNTLIVTASPVSYGRLFRVSVDFQATVYSAPVDLPAGKTRGTFVSNAGNLFNPKILSVDRY